MQIIFSSLCQILRIKFPLCTLHSTFNTFSKISGHKVNWTKLEAIRLTTCCPKTVFSAVMFSLPQIRIKYHGSTFSPQLTNLFKISLEPLLDRMQVDVEKVNVIKMVCTPKLNYLLQSLQVHIPMTYFKRFDKLCNTFIWNKKNVRLNLDRGGLGMPNLLYYYYSFSLRHLVH